MTTRFAVEHCPNQEYFRIHLSVKVPMMRSWVSDKVEDPIGEQLKQALESINGVEEASARGQSISIKRGGAFSINELVPSVLDVLKSKLDVREFTEVQPYA
jgi:hypothetical protein